MMQNFKTTLASILKNAIKFHQNYSSKSIKILALGLGQQLSLVYLPAGSGSCRLNKTNLKNTSAKPYLAVDIPTVKCYIEKSL